jgi:hypothetical protein
MVHNNFVVLDETCHWLKLMYLFQRHVVYKVSIKGRRYIKSSVEFEYV